MSRNLELAQLAKSLTVDATGTITDLNIDTTAIEELPDINLNIAPEVLEIQVDAPDMGQATMWKWTWEQSTLPYARRTITNSNELNVPLYKEGTYVVNNFAAYDIHANMTQTHSLYLKWVDGAGTDNLISWATSAGPISDTHPDINGGNATDVQRITVNVPSTVTPPSLTNPSVAYTVVNSGSGGYTFSGSANGDNPNLGPFYRGGTYTINITATGHPFYFTTDNGTNFSAGTYFGEYTSGVTGSRNETGSITFTVPAGAPDTLYYQCGNHSAMRGEITVKDLAVETNINGNYVVYFQHTQEGHRTPVELRPIPSLVNQMCLVYDSTSGKFVPQDLATYVENTPSFENKIREVAGTAELVVEDGSAVIAKVNVYDDSTYLPLTGNNPGDQAFATDTDILYIWDGTAWQQAGAANSDDLTEGSTNLFFTDARADARIALQAGSNLDLSGKSTTDLSEGSNLYYTDARADARIAASDTDALSEGSTNLYYTNTRVASYLSSNDFDTATNIVAAITDSAPGTLDTLNELAAALGDDPNFATTTANNIAEKLPLAGGTLTGNLSFGDNDRAIFGAGSDLQIYSDGANSIIHETDGTGNLIVRASNINLQNSGATATLAQFIDGGKSSLRYNNVERLATTSTGVDVTGTITSDGLTIQSNNYLDIHDADNHVSGRLRNVSGSNNALAIEADPNNSASDSFINFKIDTSEKMRIESGGHVGIGTNNPAVRLEIKDNDTWDTTNFTSSNTVGSGFTLAATDTGVRWSVIAQGTTGGGNDNNLGYHLTNAGTSGESAGYKFVMTPSGRLGIGTSSPSEKLHVQGDGADILLTDAASGQMAKLGSSGSNDGLLELNNSSHTRTILLNSSGDSYINAGNFGIGAPSPSFKLDVKVGSGAGGAGRIQQQAVTNSVAATNGVFVVEGSEGQIQVMAEDSGSWASNITLSNVPSSGTNKHWTMHHTPVTHPTISNALQFNYLATNTPGSIGGDGTGAVEEAKFTITDTGKIGIGTETPGSKLTVVSEQSRNNGGSVKIGRRNITGGLFLHSDVSTSSHYNWMITTQDTVNQGFEIIPSSAPGNIEFSNPAFVITGDNRNVGIGTSGPLTDLHIETTNNAKTGTNVDVSGITLKIHNPANDTGEAVGIGFGLSDTLTNIGAAIIHDRVDSESQGGLHFATKGAPTNSGDIPIRMTIDKAGDVGIGTLSPDAKLDVRTDQSYLNGASYSSTQTLPNPVNLILKNSDSGGSRMDFGNSTSDTMAVIQTVIRDQGQGSFNDADLRFSTTQDGVLTDRLNIARNSVEVQNGLLRLANLSSAPTPDGSSVGGMYYNTVDNIVYHWNGAKWVSMSNVYSASGGTESTATISGVPYKFHVFTSSGTFVSEASGAVDIFLAAGGGGGGADNGAGGGAGGLIQLTNHGVNPQNYSIVIGGGGSASIGDGIAAGSSGADTTGFGYTAIGGGRAGSQAVNALSGGSGGGGSWNSSPASGTTGQGNAGGAGGPDGAQGSAGGGGGAHAAGSAAGVMKRPGNGGAGKNLTAYIPSSMGDSGHLCGGGAGGLNNADYFTEGVFPVAIDSGYALGGVGGGGDVPANRQWWGNDGDANTGGGGAGGAHDSTVAAGTRQHGGNGGSGIVIIRYAI